MNTSNFNFTKDLAISFIKREFEGESASKQQIIEAWSYLISTEEVWNLCKSLKSQARQLIESQVISEVGDINWDVFNEVSNG